MKLALVSLCIATMCVLASATVAGPPLSGVWQTTDLGGEVFTGRYMETYDTSAGAIALGTTLHAQSWNGSSLGTQWSYQCGQVVSEPIMISNTVNAAGTGTRTYVKRFSGGTIWLSGDGPWANGDAEYAGPILDYVEYETIQYLNWERVHATTNVSATASIDGYSDTCLAFTVGNGVEIGSTDFGNTIPADYPQMLDGACSPMVAQGAWWDFLTMSLYVDGCSVSTDETTWDSIKAFYR